MRLLPGFVVGFFLGVVVHRGDFCMQSALREMVERRPGPSLRAYLAALGVQLVVVNILGELGLIEIPMPPVAMLAAAVGGLVFGVGMVLAKGCATSLWSRIGSGSGGATIAAISFAAGALIIVRSPLNALDRWLGPAEGAPEIAGSLTELLGVSMWIGLAGALVIIVALLFMLRHAPDDGGHWPWAVTGLALGAVGVLAWITGAFAGWNWGLSITGPARSLLNIVLSLDPTIANWGTAMLIGLPIGTFASARLRGPVSWRLPARAELPHRVGGGLLMGIGGTLALGCNIGNALTGLSVLAVNSAIATAGIFVGGAMAIGLGTWRASARTRPAGRVSAEPAPGP